MGRKKQTQAKPVKCNRWIWPTIISLAAILLSLVVLVAWNSSNQEFKNTLNTMKEREFYETNNITPMSYPCVVGMITGIKSITDGKIIYGTYYGYYVNVNSFGDVLCTKDDGDWTIDCVDVCSSKKDKEHLRKTTEKMLEYETYKEEYNSLISDIHDKRNDKRIIGSGKAKCEKDIICVDNGNRAIQYEDCSLSKVWEAPSCDPDFKPKIIERCQPGDDWVRRYEIEDYGKFAMEDCHLLFEDGWDWDDDVFECGQSCHNETEPITDTTPPEDFWSF